MGTSEILGCRSFPIRILVRIWYSITLWVDGKLVFLHRILRNADIPIPYKKFTRDALNLSTESGTPEICCDHNVEQFGFIIAR